MTVLIPRGPAISGLAIDPSSPIVLIDHQIDLLGEPHGFGGFLFDTAGRMVIDPSGMAWLYTTCMADGRWESWVRCFNVNSLEFEPARRILLPLPDRDRAVLHHIIAVDDDMIVGFYCDGRGVSACVATDPDADFVHDPGFVMQPEIGWETRHGSSSGWSLESNGAYVLIHDLPHELVFWQGYDSYRKEGRLGDLGWMKVRVDKATRQVQLLERHPDNPLSFRNPAWLCARCGGNLSSDVKIASERAFLYYVRPTEFEVFIGLALSDDPLFLREVRHYLIDTVLGEEAVVEKFQAVLRSGRLLVFYESRFADGTWHTGLRRYELAAGLRKLNNKDPEIARNRG